MTGRVRPLGFSWPVLVGLAALAAPRVVLHDLDLVREDTGQRAARVRAARLLARGGAVAAAAAPVPDRRGARRALRRVPRGRAPGAVGRRVRRAARPSAATSPTSTRRCRRCCSGRRLCCRAWSPVWSWGC
ncbi:hypothetical protein ACFQZ4_03995 [Catellatospora coxensis]